MAALSNQDVQDLEAESLNDLYAQLGRAADPGEPVVGLGETNLNKMMVGPSANAVRWPDWIQKGFNYFESVWSAISSTMCGIYQEYTEIDKDWIERAAQAILGVLNIGWAVAVIIVQIAIKRGLAALCPA